MTDPRLKNVGSKRDRIRDMQIFNTYFGDSLATFKQVGKKFDLSTERIRQIIKRIHREQCISSNIPMKEWNNKYYNLIKQRPLVKL